MSQEAQTSLFEQPAEPVRPARCAGKGCGAPLQGVVWEAVDPEGQVIRVCPACARGYARKRQLERPS